MQPRPRHAASPPLILNVLLRADWDAARSLFICTPRWMAAYAEGSAWPGYEYSFADLIKAFRVCVCVCLWVGEEDVKLRWVRVSSCGTNENGWYPLSLCSTAILCGLFILWYKYTIYKESTAERVWGFILTQKNNSHCDHFLKNFLLKSSTQFHCAVCISASGLRRRAGVCFNEHNSAACECFMWVTGSKNIQDSRCLLSLRL